MAVYQTSLLNERLQVLQPLQVLSVFFLQHVLDQEVSCAGLDPSDFQILAEGFLQVFIQITEKEKRIP